MLVEVWSDVICPWCYIGKRRLEAALEQWDGTDEVEIVYRPFQLDPRARAEPTPVADAYARKFGGTQRAEAIMEHLTEVAAAEGLEFHLDRALRANTLDAHRVLAWAEPLGLQAELKERLMHAYFSEGANVADHATLARLAGEVGLDAEAAAQMLASDEGALEVAEGLARAEELGITAVPTYVFNGAVGVPGAQDPDVFIRVLDRVVARG